MAAGRVLLGPNGAEKTTTISMVCGLLERDAGEVLVDRRPHTTRTVEEKSAIGRELGLERAAGRPGCHPPGLGLAALGGSMVPLEVFPENAAALEEADRPSLRADPEDQCRDPDGESLPDLDVSMLTDAPANACRHEQPVVLM